MGGACGKYSGQERSIQGFEGKGPFKKPRRKYEDNIKADVQDLGLGMDWITVAQVREGRL